MKLFGQSTFGTRTGFKDLWALYNQELMCFLTKICMLVTFTQKKNEKVSSESVMRCCMCQKVTKNDGVEPIDKEKVKSKNPTSKAIFHINQSYLCR